MRRFDHALLLGLAEMILVLPILLFASGYMLSPRDIPLWLGMLFVIGLLGFALSSLMNRIHVVFSGFIQAAISFPLFLLVYDVSFAGIAGGLIGCFTFIRGVHYSRGSWEDFMSASYLWYGVLFYFFASLLFSVMDEHKVFLPVIYIFGSMNILAAIIVGNSLHLRFESGFGSAAKKLNKDVKRHNYVYVGIFLIGVVILWATGVFRFIVMKIRDFILYWLTGLASDRQWTKPHQPQVEQEPFVPGGSTSSEAHWLETLLIVLAYLIGGTIVLILLFMLLRALWFALKKMIAAILAYWSRRGSKADEALGYEDEKNVLIELRDLRPKLRFWNQGSKVKWSQLKDNRERIRYLYRMLVQSAIKEGFAYRRSDTATETIRKIRSDQHVLDHQSLTLLEGEYNGARYGLNSPSDETIQTLREQLQNSKR